MVQLHRSGAQEQCVLLYVHTGGGLGPGMGVGDGELYSTVRNELSLAQFVGGLSTSSGVKLLANRRVKLRANPLAPGIIGARPPAATGDPSGAGLG